MDYSDSLEAMWVMAEMTVENIADGTALLSPPPVTGGSFSVAAHCVVNISDLTTGHKNDKHTHPGCAVVCADDASNHTLVCSMGSSPTVAVVRSGHDVKGVRCTTCCDVLKYFSFNGGHVEVIAVGVPGTCPGGYNCHPGKDMPCEHTGDVDYESEL